MRPECCMNFREGGPCEDCPDKPATGLDFESDEPLPVCPLRDQGSDTCESCQ